MMGVLVQIGGGNLELDFITKTLKEDSEIKYIKHIAPASGLQLFDVEFLEV